MYHIKAHQALVIGFLALCLCCCDAQQVSRGGASTSVVSVKMPSAEDMWLNDSAVAVDLDVEADEEMSADIGVCQEGDTRPCVAMCGEGVERCQGGQWGLCEGAEPSEEICLNDLDEDCDGLIDEGCCDQQETRCDGVDNDCDLEIDEGSVCGDLIYRHCEARLAWWYDVREGADEVPETLEYWPPDAQGDQTCPNIDQLDVNTYSCDVARAESGFRLVSLAGESVGLHHWLGIGWSCTPGGSLSAAEREVLTWAHQACHLALGYRDELRQSTLSELSPQNCPLRSLAESEPEARCVQTQSTSAYSAIMLEGVVNFGDSFALAFYCDPNQTTIPVDSRSLAPSIQEHFQVFLGLAQREGRDVVEGVSEWGGMPDQSFDRSGRVRGVGTTADGQFQAFSPSERVKDPHHFSVMTRVR